MSNDCIDSVSKTESPNISHDCLDVPNKSSATDSATSQLIIGRTSFISSDKSQLLMKLVGKPSKKDGDDNNKQQKESATKKNKNKTRPTKEQKPPKKTNNKDTGVKVHPPAVTEATPAKDGSGSIDTPDWYEELDQENIDAFRDLFNMLDHSNTGIITADNLFAELTNIDSEITYEDVEDLLKKVDKDGNGEIDFDEFLYHMTHMGDDDIVGDIGITDHEERKKKVTRRQKLFYNAITQFSIKQTMADIERTFRIRQAPHVISHYSAGVRLIGLTTRQLERQMEKMQKTAAHNDSPYAKPLQFVHMGAKVIVRRKQKVKCKPSLKDETREGVNNPAVDEAQGPDHMADFSQEIQDSLKVLTQSKGNTFPNAHLIMELRQKIDTVSAKLRSKADQQKPTIDVQETPETPLQPIILPVPPVFQPNPKSAGVIPFNTRNKQALLGNFDEEQWTSPSQSTGKKKHSTNWTMPMIEYMQVPLPCLKIKSAAHRATFNELHEIRAKAKQATDEYYSRLRQTAIRRAYEHWDLLYADLIKPNKDFRKVYCVYSPHREEEAFVICPWKPGPFTCIRHNYNGGANSSIATSSPDIARVTKPSSLRNDHKDLIVLE